MDSESSLSSASTFNLFRAKPQPGLGLGFLDAPEKPASPPPPCQEVLPSQASQNPNFTMEQVVVDGLTMLKGRVSTKEVFGLSDSDLVPGRYEGGLKLWEGSLDLVKILNSEVKEEKLSFIGKRVLELGCGHGLPGIFAISQAAAAVHFQDFNAEVLRCLTIPNVNANTQQMGISSVKKSSEAELRYFAGDWSDIHCILPLTHDNDISEGQTVNGTACYDIILMAETVYSMSALPSLYKLVEKCTSSPHGVVYVAAKKHYFGVGGGSRQFVSMVEKYELVWKVLKKTSLRPAHKNHLRRGCKRSPVKNPATATVTSVVVPSMNRSFYPCCGRLVNIFSKLTCISGTQREPQEKEAIKFWGKLPISGGLCSMRKPPPTLSPLKKHHLS